MMKKFFALSLLAISTFANADNIVVNGTRFIYSSDDKEISIKMTNTSSSPALVQSWLDKGDPTVSPDDIKVPFSITPPITRVEGKSGQTLRVRLLNSTGIPTDRESLWYLNILEVPPKVKKSEMESPNVIQMAIRSRFKFIYRPVGLGSSYDAAKQLIVSAKGKTLTVTNPTPFYVNINGFVKSNGTLINVNPETIAPKGTQSVLLNEAASKGEQLTIVSLNDYGAGAKTVITVK